MDQYTERCTSPLDSTTANHLFYEKHGAAGEENSGHAPFAVGPEDPDHGELGLADQLLSYAHEAAN